MDAIRTALEGASTYLTANPSDARYTDSAAVATLRDRLFRAAQASCVATLIAMRAAWDGVALQRLEVTVDSRSDDRGILGLDPDVPAGPLSGRVLVRVTAAASRPVVDRIVRWGIDHCPVLDGVRRAIPVDVDVEITAGDRAGEGD
jgi:uncharacterized OsmC-like protein